MFSYGKQNFNFYKRIITFVLMFIAVFIRFNFIDFNTVKAYTLQELTVMKTFDWTLIVGSGNFI